jgi:uncharacterized membrane protein YfcA
MALVLISLIVGLLVGAVGIGGVLLVPSLSVIAGIGVHEAVPACMLSYLATGAVGVVVYARHGSIAWKMVYWLCLGAIPAAYLGSLSLASIPADIVMLLIVILMILAGGDSLLKLQRKSAEQPLAEPPSAGSLIVIGAITGFGSAITGTGGPLILVPIILYLGLPVLTAVGLSQAIQIPIATFASIGNWEAGNLNLNLSFTIATSMIVGSVIGAIAIHRLPREPVRKYVASLLVIVGVGIGLRLVYQVVLK